MASALGSGPRGRRFKSALPDQYIYSDLMSLFLGIDWGGTYIKAGIVDARGNIRQKYTFASPGLQSKGEFIGRISQLLRDSREYNIKSVGIGAPGIVDIPGGSIYYLPNVPGWKNYPLRRVLRRRLGLPVFIDNDANVFALAEARKGAAKQARRALFLTLGTGLGSAIIFDGKILKGKTSSGELGHVPISLKGRECGCGASGCIETFVGNKHLLRRYKQLSRRRPTAKDVSEVYRRACQGEPAALAVWDEFSCILGRFLAGMANIFNPEIIVLGGGVAGAFSLFKPRLLKELKKQAMWPQVKGLKIVKAKLSDAGIIGAALLAKEGI